MRFNLFCIFFNYKTIHKFKNFEVFGLKFINIFLTNKILKFNSDGLCPFLVGTRFVAKYN